METKPDMAAYPFAIPTKRDNNGNILAQDISYGLTKREEFAKAAMQGICSAMSGNGYASAIKDGSDVAKMSVPEYASRMAIEFSDALISALNASGKEADGL